MTADEERTLDLPLDFLGDGSFLGDLYLDDAAGGPTSLQRRDETVSAADTLSVVMPPSGGFAARLMQTDGADR